MPAAPRLVFAGTPAFAVPSLRGLLAAGYQVVGVYTQPDRAAGRGRRLTMSPVKELALKYGLPVFQPEKLKGTESIASLGNLAPTLMVVVAYGLILPSAVLGIPVLGCVNVHASLLPRWRGAAPIARAIEAGDSRSGISLMQMEAGLDTGPVFAQSEIRVSGEDTAASLHDRLADLGAELLLEKLPALLAGSLSAQPQAESGVTYADKLHRSEAPIDWSAPAAVVANKIRALNPWPVAETRLQDQRLRLWHATPQQAQHDATPGTVLTADKTGIYVACGKQSIRVNRLQRLGGKVLAPADFLNGFPILPGDQFA